MTVPIVCEFIVKLYFLQKQQKKNYHKKKDYIKKTFLIFLIKSRNKIITNRNYHNIAEIIS